MQIGAGQPATLDKCLFFFSFWTFVSQLVSLACLADDPSTSHPEWRFNDGQYGTKKAGLCGICWWGRGCLLEEGCFAFHCSPFLCLFMRAFTGACVAAFWTCWVSSIGKLCLYVYTYLCLFLVNNTGNISASCKHNLDVSEASASTFPLFFFSLNLLKAHWPGAREV